MQNRGIFGGRALLEVVKPKFTFVKFFRPPQNQKNHDSPMRAWFSPQIARNLLEKWHLRFAPPWGKSTFCTPIWRSLVPVFQFTMWTSKVCTAFPDHFWECTIWGPSPRTLRLQASKVILGVSVSTCQMTSDDALWPSKKEISLQCRSLANPREAQAVKTLSALIKEIHAFLLN